jgi:hypothetical protein
MENVSKNLKKIVDIETGGNVHRFSNDYLGEERSDKLRAWINGTKTPNLNEIDKMVRSLKIALGKELSLDWLVYDKGNMFVEYERFVEENRIIKEELKNIQEEYGAFKKMALANFHDVDMSNQFVDNIDALDGLDVVTKNLFLGQSYFSELIGEA